MLLSSRNIDSFSLPGKGLQSDCFLSSLEKSKLNASDTLKTSGWPRGYKQRELTKEESEQTST